MDKSTDSANELVDLKNRIESLVEKPKSRWRNRDWQDASIYLAQDFSHGWPLVFRPYEYLQEKLASHINEPAITPLRGAPAFSTKENAESFLQFFESVRADLSDPLNQRRVTDKQVVVHLFANPSYKSTVVKYLRERPRSRNTQFVDFTTFNKAVINRRDYLRSVLRKSKGETLRD